MTKLEKKEKEIIRAVLSGNGRAFEWLVTRYKDTVAGICINMLKERNIADEVGQETFVRLYNSLENFKGHSTLKTYVSRIAMNLCLNKIKQQKTWRNRFTQNEDSLKNQTRSSDNIVENMANREILQMGLMRLGENHRSLVVMRMIEGYSIKETASILNIKEGSVMSGLKRALDKLKPILKDLGYEH